MYNRYNSNCFKENNSKASEAIGDLIGNKVTDKIRSVSNKSLQNNLDEAKSELEIPKERYISPKKGKKLLMN